MTGAFGAAPHQSDRLQQVSRSSDALPAFPKMRSSIILSLQRWWLAHRRDDIPDRSELDPEEFKYILPHVLICEVVCNPFRVRFRLAGSAVVAVKGLNMTGQYLDELVPSDGEPWMEHYTRAYSSRAPVFGTTWLMTNEQVRYPYEFGIFPLRRGGTEIEQFVSVEDYFHFTGPVDELVGWRLRPASEPARSR